ncbi:MAG: Txe/YoeB family addiction module toxin, partial [Bacteroidales bacterium]|nr:Txe/YoeB family addiction module toxin [Bacteroidales bacterium]
TGTGKPEALKGNRKGQWSRRITREHRLIYEIHEDIITVLIISASGHYGEK